MDALAAMTRSWPMLGALGAGLVLAALAAGAGGAPQVVLAGLGVAALGWGVLSLRAGRIAAPRTVLGVAVAALLAGGAAVVAGAVTDVAGLPLAAASVFIASTGLSAAFAVRAGRAETLRVEESAKSASRDPHALSTLVGLAVGAALVSALATPALAATEAGEAAVPHGQHGTHDPGQAH
ncbi:hypothetical protein [Agromyces sp. ZXT2-6]|uniref:hypothetical protein n=1 Tax=Agromyces sp. ZXT2-6 TaxID=3461153 RepID=UPI004055230F